jgi:formylglycine-generating enzyme required for sulfatase activity
MSQKSVFISYRRDTAAGKAFARSVHDALKHQGYDAFLDVDDISAGYWANQILTEVPKRAHFLLLVTPGAMDRCAKRGDWVRHEFELAKANQRNIVPVFEESVDITKLRQECPNSMKGIFEFQGLTLRHNDFQHGIETLVTRYIPPHKAPKGDMQPVFIKPSDDNKPSIFLVTLMLLILVAIVVGAALIFRSVVVNPHTSDESPVVSNKRISTEDTTLVLDDVNTVEADNTHVINFSPPEKKHLSRLINMSGDREQFTLINFPHNAFYTNLEDEDHSLNAGESKFLRLILTAITPELKEYPFEIRSVKHKDSIRVSIHLLGDWKAFHQQQLADFTEKTKALKSKEQIYQAAFQLIDQENAGLEQDSKQALTGQFLVNAGQTDAAVLAFAEAEKTLPNAVEQLVLADSPAVITALGKHYETMQNYVKAINWYTTAANLGDAEAEYSLGKLYDAGTGVKQDKAAAQAWYRKAAEQGHPAALQTINSKDETKPIIPLNPGVSSKDFAIFPEMVEIPAGSFMMGSDETDKLAESDEKPRHEVNIQAFKMGKYEVTQGQWKAVMGSNPSYFKECGDNCPVERVSWIEVQTFIQKLNEITGHHYRLPTEAEWEYACRAGQYTQYCGSDDVGEVAWFDGNSKNKTHPVGGKQPNAFGLYDMSGNVWEWVQDCYHDKYLGAPTDGSAWDGGAEDCGGGDRPRVLRGGAWYVKPQGVRCADRDWTNPRYRYDDGGFRLVRNF